MPLSLTSPPRNPPLLNLLKLLGHINLFDHHSHLSCLIPSRFLDFLKVNNPPGKTSIGPPFQSALNPGQRSAPHMNNYVHPTRLTGGVRRNVPYEREEQARVDGRPYVFTDYPEEKDFAHHRSQGS
ncbi:hypothetical protein D6C86_04372 [Aureobasidium pullulans]|nr:hypothetical protein D6C86_04372 [Aureobasidium pullulans]THZ95871.1 hypothetical protein D6C88_01784 [Aureobasidium pullulans]